VARKRKAMQFGGKTVAAEKPGELIKSKRRAKRKRYHRIRLALGKGGVEKWVGGERNERRGVVGVEGRGNE